MCAATTCAIATSADSRAHPFGSSLRASWCWLPQTNAECRSNSSTRKESDMRIGSVSNSLLMLIAGGTASLILTAAPACATPCAKTDLVEFEKMTWVEVKCEIAAGKTTALIYTGGVEERGPQNANGGHNLI